MKEWTFIFRFCWKNSGEKEGILVEGIRPKFVRRENFVRTMSDCGF